MLANGAGKRPAEVYNIGRGTLKRRFKTWIVLNVEKDEGMLENRTIIDLEWSKYRNDGCYMML